MIVVTTQAPGTVVQASRVRFRVNVGRNLVMVA